MTPSFSSKFLLISSHNFFDEITLNSFFEFLLKNLIKVFMPSFFLTLWGTNSLNKPTLSVNFLSYEFISPLYLLSYFSINSRITSEIYSSRHLMVYLRPLFFPFNLSQIVDINYRLKNCVPKLWVGPPLKLVFLWNLNLSHQKSTRASLKHSSKKNKEFLVRKWGTNISRTKREGSKTTLQST